LPASSPELLSRALINEGWLIFQIGNQQANVSLFFFKDFMLIKRRMYYLELI